MRISNVPNTGDPAYQARLDLGRRVHVKLNGAPMTNVIMADDTEHFVEIAIPDATGGLQTDGHGQLVRERRSGHVTIEAA